MGRGFPDAPPRCSVMVRRYDVPPLFAARRVPWARRVKDAAPYEWLSCIYVYYSSFCLRIKIIHTLAMPALSSRHRLAVRLQNGRQDAAPTHFMLCRMIIKSSIMLDAIYYFRSMISS